MVQTELGTVCIIVIMRN